MKRYILFSGMCYEETIPSQVFEESFDTEEEVFQYLKNKLLKDTRSYDFFEWAEILDTVSGEFKYYWYERFL